MGKFRKRYVLGIGKPIIGRIAVNLLDDDGDIELKYPQDFVKSYNYNYPKYRLVLERVK